MSYFKNICFVLSFFLLCSCAGRVPIQQLSVPIIVQEGAFTYSLFCEKSEYPGRFFVLPILEKQKFGRDVRRLFFRIEIKKQNPEKLIVKGFLHMQKFDGDRVFGIISGFQQTSVIIEVDLPVDISSRAVVAWFEIWDKDGPIFRSKKVKYTIRRYVR